jgi:hypothetical protein
MHESTCSTTESDSQFHEYKLKEHCLRLGVMCTSLIPATQEVETERSRLEDSPGKVSMKNKLKAKVQVAWLNL